MGGPGYLFSFGCGCFIWGGLVVMRSFGHSDILIKLLKISPQICPSVLHREVWGGGAETLQTTFLLCLPASARSCNRGCERESA